VNTWPLWLKRVVLLATLHALFGVVGGSQPAAPPRPVHPTADAPPDLLEVWPPDDATSAPLDAALTLTFSEPVALAADALGLSCELSGPHAYAISGGDTHFTVSPSSPFQPGEWCTAVVYDVGASDLDGDDPPDHLPDDVVWRFRAAANPVWINELDALTPDGVGDFIELYDGGFGNTDLRGLVLVRYRDGAGATYARALDGSRTDSRGYFVIGARAVPGADLLTADGFLHDEPAAVALYDARPEDFPLHAPPTTVGLIEATAYGPAGAELLALLRPGQTPLDEDRRGAAMADSVGRCPNGAGQRRETATFAAGVPTPDETNDCGPVDAAPSVANTVPADGATRVGRNAALEIVFSEAVRLDERALTLSCGLNVRDYTVEGSGATYRFRPNAPLPGSATCAAVLSGNKVHDADENDPPDRMTGDFMWSFTTAVAADEGVVINELDADSPGSDTTEFIELYDGGRGGVTLDGLAVVLFNGGDDKSYRVVDLDGQATDASGYLILGGATVAGVDVVLPDGLLQNGPDAVALAVGDAADFPNGTPVADVSPLDAIVYGPAATPDAGLLPLLNAGQAQVDEAGRGDADGHSLQRCPNGVGGPRATAAYRPNAPTPGASSNCTSDAAPELIDRAPGRNETGVSRHATITATFSEPVALATGWATVQCAASGGHAYTVSGGPSAFTLQPTAPFAAGESCTVTLVARHVTDLDSDDPPDKMAANVTWSFTIAEPAADFVLINEMDADTPSTDTAEFIELYDGGQGSVSLDGLTLVLFNGSTNAAYGAIDLDGFTTDAAGYFVAGNAATEPDLTFGSGTLQNGPDAVALYAGDAANFPSGAPVTTGGLIDALVYGRPADVPAGLLALLMPGEGAADEGGRGAADQHALQRCPNGAGGQRRTAAFLPNAPTPGRVSACAVDEAPAVAGVTPPDGAMGVALRATLSVAFSEPVALAVGGPAITCAVSGAHPYTVTGGPRDFQIAPAQPFAPNERCEVRVPANAVSDVDADDPPDRPAADFTWSFTTAGPVADFVLINELDADTPGNDTAEFIELYDGGAGRTDLTGLALVLYNGGDDRAYFAVDLDGARTDVRGYAVIGNSGVAGSAIVLPNGALQNGADAVALYEGRAADFPPGATLTTAGLLDAVVYGTADAADPGLLALLLPGQSQVDEAGRGAAESHAGGRCPDAAGGARATAAYRPNQPTPGAPNQCALDDPPAVVEVAPADGAADVPTGASLTVRFSEDVAVAAGWLAIGCEASGEHAATVSGGPRAFTLVPVAPFAAGEACAATVRAAAVRDADADDPPDTPTTDYTWRFQVAAPAPEGILINEIDADTPSGDTAEFIELYDGGRGRISLDGLVVVFWNGQNDTVYRAVELAGQTTDAAGYFTLGNPALNPDLTFPNAALQNGPDAVALYAGRAVDFPTGTALTTADLLDAAVYGRADRPDGGLLALLVAGQPQVDEAARDAAESHALQRCPDGAGGPRHTATYAAHAPTPGTTNTCLDDPDDPPAVVEVAPVDGAVEVPTGAALTVRFDEDVVVSAGWYAIDCVASGNHGATVAGGPRAFTLSPTAPFAAGESCAVTIRAVSVRDADTDDPPDTPIADYRWQFRVATGPAADGVLINEMDADTPGNDAAEFIELYDGGAGRTPLDGLVLVFWNGKGDVAYRAVDLAGQQTDAAGYFLVGSAGLDPDLSLPTAALQNGPDAVALYAGRATDFPKGRALTTEGLLDAVVYGAAGAPDGELLALLAVGQPQVDEAAGGAAERDALQRCPDGAGGPRHTAAIRLAPPTPGAVNACAADEPPEISAVTPAPDATDVPLDTRLVITFTEPVLLDEGWFHLTCAAGGAQAVSLVPGPSSAVVLPRDPLPPGDTCAATLTAARVHDADADDPPDAPTTDYTWRFRTAVPPPVVVAAFSHDSPVWIDQPLHFTNTSTGPGTLRHTWAFGDGSPVSTEAHPTHRYAAPGRYTVTLTVRAGDEVAVAQAIIEVRPRAIYLPAALR
jgi:hypothetical protein